MNCHEICTQAAQLTAGPRDRQHGQKADNFQRIAKFWNTYLRTRRGQGMNDPTGNLDLDAVDVAHMMVLMKLARTQSGQLNLDDYVDMAGYAGCAGEIAGGGAAGP